MSTQYVRYTPDIEATDPYFDENLQVVIDKIEEYIAGSVTTEGTGRAVRDAHAKGYVEWPEQLSPFVTVAKVRIPQQDISGDENLEKMDALSFTPWRMTAEHSPLGNIMRARKEVYRHASVLRHTLNHQQRKEPSSADEVLP